jgi:hypothetical protein
MAKTGAKKKTAKRVVPKAGVARRKAKPGKVVVKAPTPERGRGFNTETMLALLRGRNGATVKEIAEANHWLPHTTRAAISVTSRKLSLNLMKAVEEGRGLVYRVVA